MTSSLARIFPVLLLAPYIVDVSPDDSSYSEFAVGVGAGQYAMPDCSGAHPEYFRDVGMKATHKLPSSFRFGLSITGAFTSGGYGFFYPDLAYDPGPFSFGTTGLRMGYLDRLYGELAFGDQVPLFSGRGAGRFGVGWYVMDWDTHLWLGRNLFPYQEGGWAGQIDFPLAKNKYLFINGRYGKSSGIPEYGFSAGLRLRYY